MATTDCAECAARKMTNNRPYRVEGVIRPKGLCHAVCFCIWQPWHDTLLHLQCSIEDKDTLLRRLHPFLREREGALIYMVGPGDAEKTAFIGIVVRRAERMDATFHDWLSLAIMIMRELDAILSVA